MGGIHATLYLDEVIRRVDAVVTGAADFQLSAAYSAPVFLQPVGTPPAAYQFGG